MTQQRFEVHSAAATVTPSIPASLPQQAPAACMGQRRGWPAPLNILHVVDLLSQGVGSVDSDDLPVQLAIIDHGVGAHTLHLVYAPHGQLRTGDLHHIHWIAVAVHSACANSSE